MGKKARESTTRDSTYRSRTEKLYNALLNRYFGKDDPVIKDKIKIVGYVHMVRWVTNNQPENVKRLEGCKQRLLDLLEKYDDLDIGV